MVESERAEIGPGRIERGQQFGTCGARGVGGGLIASERSGAWIRLVLSALLVAAFVAILYAAPSQLHEPAVGIPPRANASLPPSPQPTLPAVDGNISIGPAGTKPQAVAVDSWAREIFVGLDPSYVDIVSTTTNEVLSTINLGAYHAPQAIAFDNATQEAYVAAGADRVVVISAVNWSIDARIAVNGSGPSGIAYDPVNGNIYVANFDSSNFNVINTSTHEITSTFSNQPFPSTIAYNPVTNQLVVAGVAGFSGWGYAMSLFPSNQTIAWMWSPSSFGGYAPFRIACDTATGTVDLTWVPGSGIPSILELDGYNGSQIAIVAVGTSASQWVWGITYDSQDQLLFATDPYSNTLVGIRASTLAIVATIPTGAYPYETEYDPSNDAIYVTNSNSQTLTVVDAASFRVSANITLAASPTAVAYDGPGGFLFAVGADHLYELSAQNHTIVTSVRVGLQPQGVAYDTQTRDVFVTNSADSAVTVYSVGSLNPVATIAVGSTPIGITYDNTTDTLYVACWGANEVDAISGVSLSVVGTAAVGLTPSAIAVDITDHELFVTNLNNDSVSVVSMSSLTVVATINLPSLSSPVQLAYDAQANEVFVSERDSAHVNVISPSSQSVVANVTVGGAPFGIAYAPTADQIIVSNYDGSNVTVIDASTRGVIGSLDVGLAPMAVVYDSATGAAYVANSESGNLSILQYTFPAHLVEFSESGLAAGSGWSVTLNAVQQSAVAPSPITFAQPNGTYSYAVTPVPGYTTTYHGQVDVQGNTTIFVTFDLFTYTVTFRETGLPPGTNWSITVSGRIETSNSTTITFYSLANGSYEFSVGGVSGYTTNDSAVTIRLNGSPVAVAINFAAGQPVESPWLYFGIGVALAAGAATGVGAYLWRRRVPSPPR